MVIAVGFLFTSCATMNMYQYLTQEGVEAKKRVDPKSPIGVYVEYGESGAASENKAIKTEKFSRLSASFFAKLMNETFKVNAFKPIENVPTKKIMGKEVVDTQKLFAGYSRMLQVSIIPKLSETVVQTAGLANPSTDKFGPFARGNTEKPKPFTNTGTGSTNKPNTYTKANIKTELVQLERLQGKTEESWYTYNFFKKAGLAAKPTTGLQKANVVTYQLAVNPIKKRAKIKVSVESLEVNIGVYLYFYQTGSPRILGNDYELNLPIQYKKTGDYYVTIGEIIELFDDKIFIYTDMVNKEKSKDEKKREKAKQNEAEFVKRLFNGDIGETKEQAAKKPKGFKEAGKAIGKKFKDLFSGKLKATLSPADQNYYGILSSHKSKIESQLVKKITVWASEMQKRELEAFKKIKK